MTGPAKLILVCLLVVAVTVVIALRPGRRTGSDGVGRGGPTASMSDAGLPRLVDLGSTTCIPCKLMAPILEQLKSELAGRLAVDFIDVNVNPNAAEQYRVQFIPTQVFLDPAGKELFRHEGYISKEDILKKWKELGCDFAVPAQPSFSRLEPTAPDSRPIDARCFMCDGDVNPKTRAVLKTKPADTVFCSPHCFFIYLSSLLQPGDAVEALFVSDSESGSLVAAKKAVYLCDVDTRDRPVVQTFGTREAAAKAPKSAQAEVVAWDMLLGREMVVRCGFCDRAVYPADACVVLVQGVGTGCCGSTGMTQTWGCCTMCALGVAARCKKDIVVEAKDALTGEAIRVDTADGHVAALVPKTAVAWAGMKKAADGSLASTGCFKQAFFANDANLKKWVEQHPTATGKMIAIEQALAAKMKLTDVQIKAACKIGECKTK